MRDAANKIAVTISIDYLLGRLRHVRQSGSGQNWMACCAVHEDRTPSLSIKALADGTILMHCFGCGANGQEVCEALGIPVHSIMPPRPRDGPDGPGGSRGVAYPWWRQRNLLSTAAHEALIVALYMESHWRGEDTSYEDEDRVMLAVQRLREFWHENSNCN